MRVAVFSESPSDEAALRVLLAAIIGIPLEPIDLNLRSRGWPAVRHELPAVLRELWINQRADGLVVSVDTDWSPVHEPSHTSGLESPCRQCVLQQQTDETIAELSARYPMSTMLAAVASASPAVEAWLLHGRPQASDETGWKAFLLTNPSRTDVKLRVSNLKRLVYGASKPGEKMAICKAAEEAGRIRDDLTGLSAAFPGGFGQMATKVSRWKSR